MRPITILMLTQEIVLTESAKAAGKQTTIFLRSRMNQAKPNFVTPSDQMGIAATVWPSGLAGHRSSEVISAEQFTKTPRQRGTT
jgi:hypothetical protein